MAVDERGQGLRVGQMASATGLTAHTLRYYERAGLITAVTRNAGGQRRYSAADVEWLQFLLRLRATGMPIADMRRYAILRAEGPSTVAARLVLLRAHEEALAQRIPELRAHRRALRDKIATYQQSLASLVEAEHQPEGA